MLSLQRPFSWGQTPRHAETGYRGANGVGPSVSMVRIASECFRESTPGRSSCETLKNGYHERPRLVRRNVHRNAVLVDSGQDRSDLHTAIVTRTMPGR